jgi:hypothetical protein
LIKQWLKAGYLDKGICHETPTGTGQGSVISPLLANVALHGMEDALGIRRRKTGGITGSRAVVRYADDVCVFCETQEDACAVLETLAAWLAACAGALEPLTDGGAAHVQCLRNLLLPPALLGAVPSPVDAAIPGHPVVCGVVEVLIPPSGHKIRPLLPRSVSCG